MGGSDSTAFFYDVSVPHAGIWLGTTEGNMLKEAGTTHWTSVNNGNNSSGFTAHPEGNSGISTGVFAWAGTYGNWWSSTEYDTATAWTRSLMSNNATYSAMVDQNNGNKLAGCSVRCVKD